MARPFKAYSFNNLLVIIFSIIFIVIIGLLSLYQYSTVAHDRNSQYLEQISETELTLNHSVGVLFEALKLYDSRYDYEMEMILSRMVKSYDQSGNDITRINISEFKTEYTPLFPGVVDFYIINASNVVEFTTYPPDIGLDFRKIPAFSKSLDKIRSGDRFIADQWVDSVNTPGYFRKYAYYPTTDHQYILEIGVHSEEFWNARKDVFSYEKLGAKILEINPDLVALSFFNKKLDAIDNRPGRLISNSSVVEYIKLDDLNSSVRKTFRQANNSIIEQGQYTINYQYFKPRNSLTPSSSEMNIVGALVYSRERLNKNLEDYLILHLIITGFAIVISILFAMYISRYISKPLEQIISDIEQIARGDYNHPIRTTGGRDMNRLGRSVQIMVSKIIRDIEEIQKSHELIALELEKRTAAENALIIANTKLNNLSGITRHDILNQVTCIRGYAYLSEQALDIGEVEQYAKDIQRLSGLIEEMIDFSRDYHTIGVSGSTWQDLSQVIHSAIDAPYENKISLLIEPMKVSVIADPLLQKVFYNLVDNSIKHGGEGGDQIKISFVNGQEDGIIIYEDQGVGISATEKELIFERGYGSNSGLGLFLIREILGITGMTIKETGQEGVGARFEIHIPKNQFKNNPLDI